MKVITIREPFCSLIKEEIKHIETRSWKTNYRGEIYIHASKSKVNLKDDRILKLVGMLKSKEFNYGNIICKANLVDCIYMDDEFIKNIDDVELLAGRYEIGRYAWVLKDVEVVPLIEAKGQLGIWNYKNCE